MRRLGLIAIACLATGLGLSAPALGAWGSAGSGGSFAKARSLPTVAAPTTSSSGRNVTVSWTAPGGATPIDGYVVKRYNGSGVQQSILAGCTGTVAATSCTEAAVPAGSWRYSVTAARSNWRGTESDKSVTVTVGAPSLSLSPATVTSLPATLNGTASQFSTGQTISFRLDNPNSGTVLTGSSTPSSIPSNGSASVSVTIPAGTANGSHTIYAVGSAGDQAGTAITVTRPTIGTSVIAKSNGGVPGHIGRNKTYYVYANVNGSGNPPAGLASLTANVSNITPGTTAAPLSSGSYSVGGSTYNYRSASLTSGLLINSGAQSYSLTATDSGGTTETQSFSVNVDISAPSASDVQAGNTSSGIAGRAEAGDTLVLTYSEQIDANSILSGWTGTSTPVVVRLNNGGLLEDSIQIYNSANSALLQLGTISLARTDYTSANRTFGATGTASTMVQSGPVVTITLGTPSAAASTAAGTGTLSWTPSASATDRAGNAASIIPGSESGSADVDF